MFETLEDEKRTRRRIVSMNDPSKGGNLVETRLFLPLFFFLPTTQRREFKVAR